MFKRFSTINRPISPHLVIYSPQISSLFSIWHRITGITLIIVFTFFMLSLKIFSLFPFLFCVSSPIWFTNLLYLFLLLIFLYHSLNGFRHIIWDIGFFLDLKSLFLSSLFSIIFIGLILSLNLLSF